MAILCNHCYHFGFLNTNKMKKYEYRMIDYDMFDENMSQELDGLTLRGWKIIRILEPMKWLNSDGMFIRIFFERKRQAE